METLQVKLGKWVALLMSSIAFCQSSFGVEPKIQNPNAWEVSPASYLTAKTCNSILPTALGRLAEYGIENIKDPQAAVDFLEDHGLIFNNTIQAAIKAALVEVNTDPDKIFNVSAAPRELQQLNSIITATGEEEAVWIDKVLNQYQAQLIQKVEAALSSETASLASVRHSLSKSMIDQLKAADLNNPVKKLFSIYLKASLMELSLEASAHQSGLYTTTLETWQLKKDLGTDLRTAYAKFLLLGGAFLDAVLYLAHAHPIVTAVAATPLAAGMYQLFIKNPLIQKRYQDMARDIQRWAEYTRAITPEWNYSTANGDGILSVMDRYQNRERILVSLKKASTTRFMAELSPVQIEAMGAAELQLDETTLSSIQKIVSDWKANQAILATLGKSVLVSGNEGSAKALLEMTLDRFKNFVPTRKQLSTLQTTLRNQEVLLAKIRRIPGRTPGGEWNELHRQKVLLLNHVINKNIEKLRAFRFKSDFIEQQLILFGVNLESLQRLTDQQNPDLRTVSNLVLSLSHKLNAL